MLEHARMHALEEVLPSILSCGWKQIQFIKFRVDFGMLDFEWSPETKLSDSLNEFRLCCTLTRLELLSWFCFDSQIK
jgi:hypothetical protein